MKLENLGVAMCELDWSEKQARAEQSGRSASAESDAEESTNSKPIRSVRLLFGTRLVR
jgi:hypothetical protein